LRLTDPIFVAEPNFITVMAPQESAEESAFGIPSGCTGNE
jgi:hypothetical protein